MAFKKIPIYRKTQEASGMVHTCTPYRRNQVGSMCSAHKTNMALCFSFGLVYLGLIFHYNSNLDSVTSILDTFDEIKVSYIFIIFYFFFVIDDCILLRKLLIHYSFVT